MYSLGAHVVMDRPLLLLDSIPRVSRAFELFHMNANNSSFEFKSVVALDSTVVLRIYMRLHEFLISACSLVVSCGPRTAWLQLLIQSKQIDCIANYRKIGDDRVR
jgi:hypothetical protein